MNTAIAKNYKDDFTYRPTRIAAELVNGRAQLSTLDQGYHIGPRPMKFTKNYIRVGLIAIHMPLLRGDRVEIEINVGAGVTLEIIEPSGLIAYNADDIRSDYTITAHVKKGGTLLWHGAEFIATEGSNAFRKTTIHLENGARALFKEEIVLGRTGEHKINLNNQMHATLEGQELLAEELVISPEMPTYPGIIDQSKAISTVTALGMTPDEPEPSIHKLNLAGPGMIWRAMNPSAHVAEDIVKPVFEKWRKTFLAPLQSINRYPP